METLQACLNKDSQDLAIIVSGPSPKTISHAQLAQNVEKLRQSLGSKGVRRGTKASIVLTDSLAFTTIFLALALQSAINAPLNSSQKRPEFEEHYKDFQPDLVVLSPENISNQSAAYTAAQECGVRIATCTAIEHGYVDIEFSDPGSVNGQNYHRAATDNDPKADDTTLVLFTSGTTGKPKAVPLTHGQITSSMSNIIKHYSLDPQDRAVVIMPLFHIHGLVAGLFAPLASGGALIFCGKNGGLSPSFVRDAIAHKATWYTATPTLHRLAMQIPMKEKPSFRFVRSCSSRLDGTVLRKLADRYQCPIVEAYAMTEAAHQVCSNPVDSARTREGSVGLPTGVDVIIVNDAGEGVESGSFGEIAIKGPNVMRGYINNDEANAKAFTSSGHFRTGDQGKIEEDGYVVLTGRIKELINKGGEKISPVEIDNVINQHPDVEEAVAFAMPDEMYGEEVGLAAVLKSGAKEDAPGMKAWVGERLMQAKVPKKVFFVKEIPKTPVGKMQRGLVAKTVLSS